MGQPDEKPISKKTKMKKIQGFAIGFLGWFILDTIILNFLQNPAVALWNLSTVIILVFLFAKKHYWAGFGIIVAIIVQYVPLILYVYYLGD